MLFRSGCALIGGETAQMPGFYSDGEYDLAGFIVGIVDRDKLITGKSIRPGDVIIGLQSTGLHTNGYSLARKLIFETAGHKPGDRVPALKEKAGAALMKIHRSYLPVIRQLTRAGVVAGMAHITGGGITENLPRILPKNISAEIDTASWPLPPLFAYLQQLGNVPQDEMLRTFNMGIGLIAVIPQAKWKRAQTLLGRLGEPFHVIGQTVKGDRSVRYRAGSRRIVSAYCSLAVDRTSSPSRRASPPPGFRMPKSPLSSRINLTRLASPPHGSVASPRLPSRPTAANAPSTMPPSLPRYGSIASNLFVSPATCAFSRPALSRHSRSAF